MLIYAKTFTPVLQKYYFMLVSNSSQGFLKVFQKFSLDFEPVSYLHITGNLGNTILNEIRALTVFQETWRTIPEAASESSECEE